MTKMVRKQLYIEAEHDEKLKQLSADLGVTEAEVIRRAIDGLRLDEDSLSANELRAALETLEKLTRRSAPTENSLGWSRADIYRDYQRPRDRQAWLEERAFIEERARLLPAGGSTKKARREDSYDDERQARLSR
jgi:predicted DNA-binding protein